MDQKIAEKGWQDLKISPVRESVAPIKLDLILLQMVKRKIVKRGANTVLLTIYFTRSKANITLRNYNLYFLFFILKSIFEIIWNKIKIVSGLEKSVKILAGSIFHFRSKIIYIIVMWAVSTLP